jgi:hypothetical protein
LETEQIEYLYKSRLTTEEAVKNPELEAKGEAPAEGGRFNQFDTDQQVDEVLRELEDS